MRKAKKFLILSSTFLIVFLILAAPAVSLAYRLGEPIVPSCPNGCGWTELLTLVNNAITFILEGLAVPIAAIMFAYAGFLLVTAGGEVAHARTKAKEIFTNAVFGLVFIAGAWLIIKTILMIVGYKDAAWIGF